MQSDLKDHNFSSDKTMFITSPTGGQRTEKSFKYSLFNRLK
jgi:hypothetical protein